MEIEELGEDRIFEAWPLLRECVAAIRRAAGRWGSFRPLTGDAIGGWTWEVGSRFIMLDTEDGGAEWTLTTGDIHSNDDEDDGPADDENGNKPTPELAARCGVWLLRGRGS
jgi:hypothetical protein